MINRTTFASVAVLAASAALTAAAAPSLTADGWGSLKIGARESEVRKVLAPYEVDGEPSDPDYVDCHHIQSKRTHLTAMIQDGRLTRLSLWHSSPIQTDKGLGLGATERAVRKAYPHGLEVSTAEYEEEPSHSLRYWNKATRRGVRYITDAKGRVVTIHAGDDSIDLIEGCL